MFQGKPEKDKIHKPPGLISAPRFEVDVNHRSIVLLADWIDDQLVELEATYSEYRTVRTNRDFYGR